MTDWEDDDRAARRGGGGVGGRGARAQGREEGEHGGWWWWQWVRRGAACASRSQAKCVCLVGLVSRCLIPNCFFFFARWESWAAFGLG